MEKALEMPRQRFASTSLVCNADIESAEVREHCQVEEAGCSLLKAALSMSAGLFTAFQS